MRGVGGPPSARVTCVVMDSPMGSAASACAAAAALLGAAGAEGAWAAGVVATGLPLASQRSSLLLPDGAAWAAATVAGGDGPFGAAGDGAFMLAASLGVAGLLSLAAGGPADGVLSPPLVFDNQRSILLPDGVALLVAGGMGVSAAGIACTLAGGSARTDWLPRGLAARLAVLASHRSSFSADDDAAFLGFVPELLELSGIFVSSWPI